MQEFREVFQEVSGWLDSAEKRLERARRASEDRQLEEQVAALRPKVRSIIVNLVNFLFSGGKPWDYGGQGGGAVLKPEGGRAR